MRKLFAVFTLMLVAGCGEVPTEPPITVEPQFARGDDGVVQSATGSGHFHPQWGFRTFSFNAIERANGVVSGSWQLGGHHDEKEERHSTGYDVECLVIMDNVAYVGGYLTRSKSSPVYQAIFKVVDNGEGKKAEPDQITWTWNFSLSRGVEFLEDFCAKPGPSEWRDWLDGEDLFDVEGGNVQVRGG